MVHSPVLQDGSCKHAITYDTNYTYADGRANEKYKKSKHAVDGVVTDILQPNGQKAWAETYKNIVKDKQRILSVIDGNEQKVLTIPENALSTEKLKDLAKQNSLSFARPAGPQKVSPQSQLANTM